MKPMRLGSMVPWSPISNKAIQIFLPDQSSQIYMNRSLQSLVSLENRKTLFSGIENQLLEIAGKHHPDLQWRSHTAFHMGNFLNLTFPHFNTRSNDHLKITVIREDKGIVGQKPRKGKDKLATIKM